MATSIIKAVIGGNAAKKAASQQAEAQNAAANEQRSQFQKSEDNINKAAADAQAGLRNQYTQTQGLLNPFIGTGTNANQQLNYLLGLGGNDLSGGTLGDAGSLGKAFTMQDFQQDPSYAFRLAEGQKALARAQSARGKYFSGGAIKALSDYNQNAASQEYQNAYSRYTNNQNNLYNKLSGLSGTGLTAANSLAGYGQNTANNLATIGTNAQQQIANLGAGKAAAVGNNLVGAGNALAQGTLGNAQAWDTGLQGVSNAISYAAGNPALAGSNLANNITAFV